MPPVNSWVFDEKTGEYYAPGTYDLSPDADTSVETYGGNDLEANLPLMDRVQGFLEPYVSSFLNDTGPVGPAIDTTLSTIGLGAAKAPSAIAKSFGEAPARVLGSALNQVDNPVTRYVGSGLRGFADELGSDINDVNSRLDSYSNTAPDSTASELSGYLSNTAPALMALPFGPLGLAGQSGVGSTSEGIKRLESRGATPGAALAGGAAEGLLTGAASTLAFPYASGGGSSVLSDMAKLFAVNAATTPVQEIVSSGIDQLASGTAPSFDETIDRMKSGLKSAAVSSVLPVFTHAVGGGGQSIRVNPDEAFGRSEVLSRAEMLKRDLPQIMARATEIKGINDKVDSFGKLPTEAAPIDAAPSRAKMLQQDLPQIMGRLSDKTGTYGPKNYTPKLVEKVLSDNSMPRPEKLLVPDAPNNLRERVTGSEMQTNKLVESALAPLAGKPPVIKQKTIQRTMPRPEEIFAKPQEAPKQISPPPGNDTFRLVGQPKDIGGSDLQQAKLQRKLPGKDVKYANYDAVETYTPADAAGELNLPIPDSTNAPIRTLVEQQRQTVREGLLKTAETAQVDRNAYKVVKPKYGRIGGAKTAPTVFEDGSITYTDPNGVTDSLQLDADFRKVRIQNGERKVREVTHAPENDKVWRLIDTQADGTPVVVVDKLTFAEARKVGMSYLKARVDSGGTLAPKKGIFEVPERGPKGEHRYDDAQMADVRKQNQTRLRAKVLGQRGVLNLSDILDVLGPKEYRTRRQLRKSGVEMSPEEESSMGYARLRDWMGEKWGQRVSSIVRGLDSASTFAERSPKFKSAKIILENGQAVGNQVINRISPLLSPFLTLSEPSRVKVSNVAHQFRDIIANARAEGKKLDTSLVSDNYIKSLGLNDAEVSGLKSLWTSFDAMLPDIGEALMAKAPNEPEARAEYESGVNEFLATLKGSGYVPRNRAGKEFLIQGRDAEGREYRSQHNSAEEAANVLKDLKASGATVKMSKMARDAVTDLRPQLSAEVNNALGDFGLNEPGGVLGKYQKQMDAGGRQGSFIRHFVKARNVQGYDRDITNAVIDYVEGLGNFKGEQITARPLAALMDSIEGRGDEPGGEPHLRKTIESYIKYVKAPETVPLRRLSRLIDFFSLAGVPMSGFINLLQSQNTVALAFAREGPKGVQLALSTKRYSLTGTGNEKLPADIQEQVSRAQDSGLMDQNGFLNTDIIKRGPVAKVENATMKTFSIPEAITRRNAFVTGALIGKSKGLTGDGLFLYAKEFLTDTMGDYSKTNATNFEINGGSFGVLTPKLMLKYKKYMINQFRLMRKLATQEGWKGKASVVGLISSQIAIAGVMGLPGFKDTKQAAELAGYNPDEFFRNYMKDEDFRNQILYGLPNKSGFDLSASAGTSPFIPETKGNPLAALGSLLAGPAAQIVTRPYFAYDAYTKGSPVRAAEQMLPRFARGPIRAAEMALNGEVRAADGRLLTKGSPAGILGAVLGATPSSSREEYNKYREAQRLIDSSKDDPNEFTLRLAKAIFSGDEQTQDDLRQEISSYNEKMLAAGNPERVYMPDKHRDAINFKIATMGGGDSATAAAIKRAPKDVRDKLAEIYGLP